MAKLLRMPKVAANAVEAVLQDWSRPDLSSFTATDVLATIETEKAVVDVEAGSDGVLLKTLVRPGTLVTVGSPIALLGELGEQVDDVDAMLAELGVTPAEPAAAPERRDVPAATPAVPSSNGSGPSVPHQGRIFGSPLARRLARDAGLALETLTGSGPGGRIVRRDVEAAIARGPAPVAPATAALPAPALAAGAAYTDLPHTRMRQAIANRLVESKQTAPHFYVRATLRVDALLALREQLNASGDMKVSVNDLLVKAAARAHRLVPEMNVSWTPQAVRLFATVDIAVAVATDRGLVTPVVRQADTLSISALSATAADLAERARAGRLQQEELEGGTLSISNLGMYGTEEFTAIINPPQAAILAVGAARQGPVVTDGRLEVASVMRVTLSVDHRPVDGVVAARWMAALTSVVENPVRILA